VYPTQDVVDLAGIFPQPGDHLVQISSADFRTVCEVIRESDFGFADTFGYLLPKAFNDASSLLAKDVVEFLNSLVVDRTVSNSSKLLDVFLKTLLDVSFEKKLYAHSSSLPQRASDAIVKVGGQILLGRKNRSPTVTIHFEDGSQLELLKVGKHGHCFQGEHVNPEELAQARKLSDQVESTGPFLLEGHQTSLAVRTLVEESFGLTELPPMEVYCVGVDSVEGRDDRYTKCGPYGYPRESSSLMFFCRMQMDTSVVLTPSDQEECAKPTFFEIEKVLEEFRPDGEIPCAFPSHPRMLKIALGRMAEFKL